ncbi:FtsX-like permease family protein, partial [Acinetobacter soli]|uniref:FtsX-like permease family protein n=1 Tax=Acinetobacter soli TaxID=487316 RepID=UPI002813EC5A
DWRSSLGEFFKAVALEKLSMSIMLMLIVVVASFNILSALTMMVGSRLTDIAILKTLGLRSRQILKIFMYMGVSY